jgi:hypothetical protein
MRVFMVRSGRKDPLVAGNSSVAALEVPRACCVTEDLFT